MSGKAEELARINTLLKRLRSVEASSWAGQGQLRVGVDLGTANVVVVAVDEEGAPAGLALEPAEVVRDGLVVDYMGAISIVKRLVGVLESKLGVPLRVAATAIPPGTREGDVRATKHVVEAAGLEVVAVVDEPSAAATALGIDDGAVVDMGGGTTGISILKEGRVVYTADEPTGGRHVTLVIAGRLGISFEEAESLKLSLPRQKSLLPIVRPVFEKVGSIVKRHIESWDIPAVYLVGGGVAFHGFPDVIQDFVRAPVFCPEDALLVTPYGIALECPVVGGD